MTDEGMKIRKFYNPLITTWPKQKSPMDDYH